MAFIIIYVTHPSEEHANKISSHLIEKKMVACANIFSMKSGYWWQGNIENEDEYISILKTIRENFDKVKKEIEKIHDYDVPCIMKMDVEANDAYENWIRESVDS